MYSGRGLAHSSLHLACLACSGIFGWCASISNKRQTLFEAHLVFQAKTKHSTDFQAPPPKAMVKWSTFWVVAVISCRLTLTDLLCSNFSWDQEGSKLSVKAARHLLTLEGSHSSKHNYSCDWAWWACAGHTYTSRVSQPVEGFAARIKNLDRWKSSLITWLLHSEALDRLI